MNRTNWLIATSSVLLITGCLGGPSRIDNALLSELTPEAMSGITQARASWITAEDGLAKAERDTVWAAEEVRLARSSLKVGRAKLDDTNLSVALAKKSGTVDQLQTAEADHVYFSAQADELRSLLALRKRELERARLAETLAREQLRLHGAQVELEKAMAVQSLERVSVSEIPLKDYRLQVRYHETEVQLAKVRLEAAAAAVTEERREYDAARAKAAALKPAPQPSS